MPNKHDKVWDEITYPFPNFKVAPLKFGDWEVISSHFMMDVITYTCRD